MESKKEVPKMKVFTVGLDQKPPLEESKSPPSPPPSYKGMPSPPPSVIMGPEPPPIIIRRRSGYKGCLIVLLSVFLVALFALTLSEIAYNRQRDENFFRLRWAELKHRMGWNNDGYGNYWDNWHRWHNLQRPQDLQPPVAELQMQTFPPPTTEASTEKPNDQSKQAGIADRLQFFRQLLEGIKKQAESMGFDGTMQVSVVQVDPISGSAVDNQDDSKSDSFLDGFGEVHMPQQASLESKSKSNSDSDENDTPINKIRRPFGLFNNDDFPAMHFPRMGMPFRPDWMKSSFERLGENEKEDNRIDRFFPKVEVIDIPVNQEAVGSMYGRRFGRILQDIIASRLQNFQNQMNSFMRPRPETSPNPVNLWWQPVRPQWPQARPFSNGLEFNNQFHHPFPAQTPPPFIFFPNPPAQHFSQNNRVDQPEVPRNFIPPEDRIQIEPPTHNFVDWKPWNSDNGNGFINLNNEVNRGWTHQEIRPEENPQAPQPNPEPVQENQVPIQNQAGRLPSTVLDGTANEKKIETLEERPLPILSIDPPAPEVDFPAVRFPMNDENQQHEHNPIFFQVDEPQQQEQAPEK